MLSQQPGIREQSQSGFRQQLLTISGLLFGSTPDTKEPTEEQLVTLRRDEVANQVKAIRREIPVRTVVLLLVGAIFLLYLPPGLVVAGTFGIFVFDHLERLFWERHNETRSPIAKSLALASVYFSEFLFSLPSALIWHLEDAFTKAISVGVMAAALMRLATVRSVLPISGIVGVCATLSLVSVSNSLYWLSRAEYAGFAITSLIAIVAHGYVVAAILQNHRQLRDLGLAQMHLTQSNDVKSRFLQQMSHELRTPLNAIIGLGHSARLGAAEETVKQQLGVLVKSAEGLSVVLDDLLDLSAIEDGRLTLRKRAADFRQELDLIVALFRPQADLAQLELHISVAERVPQTLRLDYDRLRQCMANLLSNALKHTHFGQIVVRADFQLGQHLVIEVADSGPGVPADRVDRLFTRYERVGSNAQGYGLGLSICKALLHHMGGDIRLVPTSMGAVFEITIPAETVADVASVAGPDTVQDLRGMRVLVVDDVGTNRMVAALYLRLLDCEAIEAPSGAQAMTLLQGDLAVDAILLDINMPGMDGIQTLAAIRTLDHDRGRLAVIAMTAEASAHDRERHLGAGMDGYVAKPIDLALLRTELGRAIAYAKKMR